MLLSAADFSQWTPSIVAVVGSAAVALINYGATKESVRSLKSWVSEISRRHDELAIKVQHNAEVMANLQGRLSGHVAGMGQAGGIDG